MTFNKTTLLDSLSKCMPGVSTGIVTLEGADSFVFRDGWVHSYNTAISVSVKLQDAMPEGIVNAKDFYKTLSKFPKDDCELEATDTEWIIKCGRIKVKMKLIVVADIASRFANITPNEANWCNLDGAEFVQGLKNCFMPTNKTQLSGIAIATINNKVQMISTDQYQINVSELSNPFPNVWINNDAIKNLMTWDNFVKVQLNKTWLQFADADGTLFSVKALFANDYPTEKIVAVIDKTNALTAISCEKLTPDFFDAVDRASGFSENKDNYNLVNLKFSQTGLTIASKKSSGTYEETLEDKVSATEYSGNFDVGMLMFMKDKDSDLTVYELPAVSGMGRMFRFKFQAPKFLSIISSF